MAFQSTRPSRGATPLENGFYPGRGDFNPRAPRGARLLLPARTDTKRRISIHAPLAGRDSRLRPCPTGSTHFNPRAPRGARPVPPGTPRVTCSISIHAPLAGRDRPRSSKHHRRSYFNPRAPRGARRRTRWSSRFWRTFQSTRPSRGATTSTPGGPIGDCISIHAPLAGRDGHRGI